MKKIVILQILLVASLYALSFDEAKGLYDKKEYQKSYDAFKSLFMKDVTNENYNLFLARSALEIGRYNEAIAAYERVLIAKPSHITARVELAITYYRANLADQAEVEFKRVLSSPIPKELRESVIQYMAAISGSREKHTVGLFVSVGVQDDSNIRFDSDKTVNGLTNEAISGRSHFEQLSFNHIYNMKQKESFWQSRATLYNQEFFALSGDEFESRSPSFFGGSSYDILYSQVETGLLKRFGTHSLYFPIGFSVLEYGGMSYFKDISAGVEMDKRLSRTNQLALKGKLTKRLSLLYPARDALVADLSMQIRNANDKGDLIIYGASLQLEDQEESDRSDITTITLDGKRIFALAKEWSLTLGAQLKHRGESKKTALIDKKRRDLVGEVQASLNMPIDKSSFIALNASYAQGDSNNHYFDYKREVVGVSYNYYFGNSDIKKVRD